MLIHWAHLYNAFRNSLKDPRESAPYFGNHWVMWNVSNSIKNSLPPLSFFSLSIYHVFDLICLSVSKGPLRKCLPEVKYVSRISKGKGVERNLIQQRGCEGTVRVERERVLEKTDPSASSAFTYLTYSRDSLNWPTQTDTKHCCIICLSEFNAAVHTVIWELIW